VHFHVIQYNTTTLYSSQEHTKCSALGRNPFAFQHPSKTLQSMENSQDSELSSLRGDLHSLHSYPLCIKYMLGVDNQHNNLYKWATTQSQTLIIQRISIATRLRELNTEQNKYTFIFPHTCFGYTGLSSERTCETQSKNDSISHWKLLQQLTYCRVYLDTNIHNLKIYVKFPNIPSLLYVIPHWLYDNLIAYNCC